MGALPEGEEAEHRFGLLALAQVRIGIAERAGIGVVGEKDKDARLAAAALRHIVALDARVRPVVGHGVEVEVERLGGEQRRLAEHGAVPSAEQGAGVLRRDTRGVLAEIALLRDAVQCAEQPQPLVESPGQRGEAELAQHLAHGGGAQWRALLLEGFGDFVDGVIAFAQQLDGNPRGGLLRLALGTAYGGEEEGGRGVTAEVVAQHAKRALGVAELGGDLFGGAFIDEVAAQRLVLALFGVLGLAEKAPALRYLFRYSDRHICTLSHTTPGVNRLDIRCALALASYGKSCNKRESREQT